MLRFALENASRSFSDSRSRTDTKEKKIFLIYKEIQKGAVAKSYVINGLLLIFG